MTDRRLFVLFAPAVLFQACVPGNVEFNPSKSASPAPAYAPASAPAPSLSANDGLADPTLLPAAAGQPPAAGSYGRNLSAGQTYQDPNTNVTVLKLTDASTPEANGGVYKGYSEGGPNISLPWRADGATYYTLRIGRHLVDLRYDQIGVSNPLSNWRSVPTWGEIGFAFSLNPETPRVAFLVSDDSTTQVHRYNTATNLIENTGSWPWDVSAHGNYMGWLQNSLNDEWFVGMLNSNHTIVAFRPSDGLKRAITPASLDVVIDEPHIDREHPYVYVSTDDPARQNIVVSLETGASRVPQGSGVIVGDDHNSPVRGGIVGLSHWERYSMYYYDLLNDRTTEFATSYQVRGVTGDYHQAGQWLFNNGSGLGQWFVIDSFGSENQEASECAVRRGMIAFVRPKPFEARLLVAHDSSASSYERMPKPTLSPDGKLVMWLSDMNGSARWDIFLARTPVK